MTEADLLECVIDCAHLFGWKVAHFRPAKTERGWRTPVQGDGKGFPDLVLARAGEVLFVELKSANGVVSKEQHEWIEELSHGCNRVEVWRPFQWVDRTIEKTLRR